jgi:hypothetical protein
MLSWFQWKERKNAHSNASAEKLYHLLVAYKLSIALW